MFVSSKAIVGKRRPRVDADGGREPRRGRAILRRFDPRNGARRWDWDDDGAGYGFLQTVQTSGFQMIAAGAALASLFVRHRVLRLPFGRVMGLTSAIHAELASLAFASLIANSEARVFLVCTVAKIVLAQW